MGKKSSPKAPDPIKTASGQTATNIGTAIANQITGQVNQNTPYGSLTYDQTGSQRWTDPLTGRVYDIPTYTANQTLTPAGQKLQDATMATQQNLANIGRDQSALIGDLLSNPLDLNGLPAASGGVNLVNAVPGGGKISTIGSGPQLRTSYGSDFSADRRRVERTLMDRMQPGLDQDRAALEQRLADQGIQYGTAAYEAAMGDMGRQTNDARMSAILAGGDEQSRLVGMERDRAAFGNDAAQQMFRNRATAASLNNAAQAQRYGQNMSGAQFTNQSRLQEAQAQDAARARALQERFSVRNQPLNEISSLMGGSQLQAPNFMSGLGTSVANTDYAGIVQQDYANRMAGWNANQGIWGGLLGGAASLFSLSDRRAKTDVEKVGKLDNGLPVYSYRYKTGGPTQIGLMAQDVVKEKSEAVKRLPGGLMAVNYKKAVS